MFLLLKLIFYTLVWRGSAFYIRETVSNLKSLKNDNSIFIKDLKLNQNGDNQKVDSNGFPFVFSISFNHSNGTIAEFIKIKKRNGNYPANIYTIIGGAIEIYENINDTNKEVIFK
jgi:hypothetical protein